MDNTQSTQPTPRGDTLPSALADIVQFLKRKREARIASQRSSAPDSEVKAQP